MCFKVSCLRKHDTPSIKLLKSIYTSEQQCSSTLETLANNNVCISSFFLLGLTRDFPPAEEAFLKADGFSLLIRAMQAENDKLITKSAFMLRHMLFTNPSHKGI